MENQILTDLSKCLNENAGRFRSKFSGAGGDFVRTDDGFKLSRNFVNQHFDNPAEADQLHYYEHYSNFGKMLCIFEYFDDCVTVFNDEPHGSFKANSSGDFEVKFNFEEFEPDILIHCAASYNDKNDILRDMKTNAYGTTKLVDCCKKYNCNRIIYFQTSLCYKEHQIEQRNGIAS